MPFKDRIDPSLWPWIENLPKVDTSDWPLEIIAKFARERPVVFPLVEDPNIEVIDHALQTSGVKVRHYAHKDRTGPAPAFVYYHGGGFFSGSIAHNDTIAQLIALTTGVDVVTVEYRKTPEHPYPTGFDDCYDTFLWAADNDAFDKDRIAVGGISAGGSLAASVALKARDVAGPKIVGQVLIIPGLDHRFETPSSYMDVDTRIWHRTLALKAWDAWLLDIHEDIPSYASPAIASDFSNLPPTFVSVESEDILRDEGIAYADALKAADVRTDVYVSEQAFHASFAYMPFSDVSKKHFKAIVEAIIKFTQSNPPR